LLGDEEGSQLKETREHSDEVEDRWRKHENSIGEDINEGELNDDPEREGLVRKYLAVKSLSVFKRK
jgi:hypothetical protein